MTGEAEEDPAGWTPSAEVPFLVSFVPAFALMAYSGLVLVDSIGDIRAGRPPPGATEPPSLAVPLVALAVLFAELRLISLFVLALLAHRRRASAAAPPPPPERRPLVSVIVPAFNEGRTIESTLETLAALDYPRYEVIVIDDGSTDGTFAVARRFEGERGRCSIEVHRKPNGGKWSALNLGLARSRGDLVLFVDADSHVAPDALGRLVARIERQGPGAGAVCGQIRVRNRANLLTLLQALEYVIANGITRMAQGLSRTVLIVPGPIGLYRRSVLMEVARAWPPARPLDRPGDAPGPLSGDTFCEDFDLSLAVLELGYRIDYEPAALSHTKAPDWPFALLNQRYRWVRGSMQVVRKHLPSVLAAAGARPAARPLLAWVAAGPVLEAAVLPPLNLLALAASVAGIASGEAARTLAGLVLGLGLVDLNVSIFALVAQRERLELARVLPLFYPYYLLLNLSWAFAALDEARGAPMRW